MLTKAAPRMRLLPVLLSLVLVTAGMTLVFHPQPAAALAVDADQDGVVEEQFLAYVTNEGSDSVSVIDTLTNTVRATIEVGDSPAGVTFTPKGKTAYVANLLSGTVSVIDTKTDTVVATIEDESFSFPLAVAITPDGARVYVTNFGIFGVPFPSIVSVIDTKTNTVVDTVEVGVFPEGVAIAPNGRKAYVANEGSNTVSVIETETNSVVDEIPVGRAPSGVAFTPNGKTAYVTNYFSDFVSVIDAETNTVMDEITVGLLSNGLAITPNGKTAYVTNFGNPRADPPILGNTVVVIDTKSNTVVDTIEVGNNPLRVAFTPDGRTAYVTNRGSNNVSVIDTKTNTVVDTVGVGSEPTGVAITR